MPRPKWLTKLVSKSESPPDRSTSGSSNSLSTDWVSNAIQVAKITASAGELAPFPYIKGAAGIFVALLEPVQVPLLCWLKLGSFSTPNIVQQLKQNQDDFKALTDSISSILNILHEEVKAQPEAAKDSVQFNTLCAEFKS